MHRIKQVHLGTAAAIGFAALLGMPVPGDPGLVVACPGRPVVCARQGASAGAVGHFARLASSHLFAPAHPLRACLEFLQGR